MKIGTINQIPKTILQSLKSSALIAAVAVPTLVATSSCNPVFYDPYKCQPANHPAVPPPQWYYQPLHHLKPSKPIDSPREKYYGDIKTLDLTNKELSLMA